MKRVQAIHILLLISNIFFLLLFFTLSFNNRLAIDDFYFLGNLNDHGVFQGALIEYDTWSTRWASVFVNYSILSIHKTTGNGLILFGLVTIITFTFSVFLLIKNLFFIVKQSPTAKLHFNSLTAVNMSLFVVSVIFISTIKIDETWFWLCAACTYLWANMFLLLGVAWLINRRKNFLLSLLGCFSFMFIGGASGPLAIITLLIILVFLMKSSTLHEKVGIDKSTMLLRSVLAFIFCLTAFVILFNGNGNRIRETFFNEISLGESIVLNIKMTGIVFLKRLLFVLPQLLILCMPMLYVGSHFYRKDSKTSFKRKTLYLTVVYLLMVFFYQLSITYKTQDVGAYRALFTIALLSVTYFLALYFFIGQYIRFNNKVLKAALFIPVLLSIIVFSYTFFEQKKIVETYSQLYDERMEGLNANRVEKLSQVLTPLPSSGMLYSAEIDADTSHFSNQHLQKGLDLNFSVRVKNE